MRTFEEVRKEVASRPKENITFSWDDRNETFSTPVPSSLYDEFAALAEATNNSVENVVMVLLVSGVELVQECINSCIYCGKKLFTVPPPSSEQAVICAHCYDKLMLTRDRGRSNEKSKITNIFGSDPPDWL